MNYAKLRILLYPFSLIFAAIASIRNLLFDKGLLESTPYPIPVISVGNLTVGGTGKTPLTEFILRHLQRTYQCALLSRGYGRKTKGIILADDTATAATIGDEPMQIHTKFDSVLVAVAAKRREGMKLLLQNDPAPQVVVLDDAFQHRYVKPGLSIVVIDYYRPVWNDLCLPAGNLREPRSGLKRAQLIVVNKCPASLSEQEAQQIRRKLKISNPERVFFTTIRYGTPVPLKSQSITFASLLSKPDQTVVALAGIGNPEPFFKMVTSFGVPVEQLRFPDHHDFTSTDIKKMETLCNREDQPPLIITTEKDAIRLLSAGLPDALLAKMWYIPIELEFLFDGQQRFINKTDTYVREN